MTKSDFVSYSYGELGFPTLWFSQSNEQKQVAARRLEDYLAEEEIQGVRIGWPFSRSKVIDLSQECNIPNWVNSYVYRAGAVAIASIFGKEVSVTTKSLLSDSRLAILNVLNAPRPKQPISGTPRGSGNYTAVPYYPGVFYNDYPSEQLPTGNDNSLIQ